MVPISSSWEYEVPFFLDEKEQMVPICNTWEQEVPFFCRSKGTTGSVIISLGTKGPLWIGPIFLSVLF